MNRKYKTQTGSNPCQIRGWGPFSLASEVNISNSPGVNFLAKLADESLFYDRLIETISAYADFGRTATAFYDEVQ